MAKARNEITTQDPPKNVPSIPLTERGGLQLGNFTDLMQFAQMMVNAKFAPPNDDWQTVVLKIQAGAELGLGPMAAMQNIAVVNNRPTVWGDAVLAICMRERRVFDTSAFREWFEVDGEIMDMADVNVERIISKDPKDAMAVVARCECRRLPGGQVSTGSFSMADARHAGLYPASAASAWAKYPKRMLQMRARAFALRDAFPDILRGLYVAEEIADANTALDVDSNAPTEEDPRGLADAAAKSRQARNKSEISPNQARNKRPQNGDTPPDIDPLDELDAVGDEPTRVEILGKLIHAADSIDRMKIIAARISTLKEGGELSEGSAAVLKKVYREQKEELEEREAIQEAS